MGVEIGGDAAKIGKNTHLLVIMRVRLPQKLVFLNWRIRLDPKKETSINNVRKLWTITAELI